MPNFSGIIVKRDLHNASNLYSYCDINFEQEPILIIKAAQEITSLGNCKIIYNSGALENSLSVIDIHNNENKKLSAISEVLFKSPIDSAKIKITAKLPYGREKCLVTFRCVDMISSIVSFEGIALIDTDQDAVLFITKFRNPRIYLLDPCLTIIQDTSGVFYAAFQTYDPKQPNSTSIFILDLENHTIVGQHKLETPLKMLKFINPKILMGIDKNGKLCEVRFPYKNMMKEENVTELNCCICS